MKKTDQRKVLQNGHDTVLINQHFADLNPLFIGSENCKPGKSFGPTVRNYTLIHYVVQGEGKLFKNGEVYSVHAGEAFLILPDEIVTYRADEKNPWHYQWVGFDGTLTERFRDLAPVIRFPSGLIREMIEVLEKDLKVMDSTAASMCRDSKIAIMVFNIEDDPQNLVRAMRGESVGTIVKEA